MPSDTDPPGGLHKKTNWWGAFVIGLAGTILVTGVAPFAVQSVGAASIPLFFFVTGAGVILCFCLAELAAAMPDRTGGMPSYAYETFRGLGPGVARHIGGISAWGYGLGWFPVAPINMILAARYIATLWGIPLGQEFTPISAPINETVIWISVAGLLLLFIPCYLGIRLGAGFATLFGVVSMVPLTLLVFLPFFKPETLHWSNVSGFPLADPTVRVAVRDLHLLEHGLPALRLPGPDRLLPVSPPAPRPEAPRAHARLPELRRPGHRPLLRVRLDLRRLPRLRHRRGRRQAE
ncbi:MAG: hypothetical protein A3F84_28040 [Candidatus Handelsmanbacteria bacterium RIFCSPLOWO2_12_FULL_64_10]|uniref:Amino acid permease/ SLC12A domain-containing protein n=1 Tax=Handelsmanbacteria sp. (strain RIFCSPLOWO2_12_FULL_64_10) TaxID=1817868 RepID=A0A1F6C4Q8_HANXR|nr:MAG: hypothetical protein A3F84_28040 [Candidatus Handelsmanbacteria bacterium RIFCSPLOWO2_12_FULL_64_10]